MFKDVSEEEDEGWLVEMMMRMLKGLIFSVLWLIIPILGFAQTVIVSWEANTEPDLLGYKIYYGTSSRNYDHVLDVGNVTEKEVSNLSLNTTYYFAVTAYDTAYNESDYSEEVSITLTDSVQNPVNPPASDPPVVTDVVLINRQTLKIYFSQKMDFNSLINAANYTIYPQVELISIKPDPSLMFVEITTSTHSIETTYTLTVQNLMNQDGIGMAAPYSKSYSFPDEQPPFVTGILLLDLQHIQISFSERMDLTTIQNVANYSIQPSVAITSIQTDSTGSKVTLNTEPHSNSTTYTLTVQNVKDQKGNRLPNPFSVAYSYVEQSPPQVVSAEALDRTTLVVFYSKKMDYVSLGERSNYQIQPAVDILDIIVDPSMQKVTLRTSEHRPLLSYQLTVRNVKDFSQTPLSSPFQFTYSFEPQTPLTPPATPATVTDVIPTDLHTIRIYFSQQMDETSATDPANYRISPGIQIVSISLDSSKMFVILTTTAHEIGKTYELYIQNVKNISDLPLAAPYQHTYSISDATPPFVSGIHLINMTSIQIVFSEPVDQQTALRLQNYSISPQVAIKQVTIDQTGTQVTLTTDPHSASVNYVLTVQNLRDRQGNTIANPFSISYSFADQTPPEVTQVQTMDRSTLLVLFSKKMDYNSVSNVANYEIQPYVKILAIIPDTSLRRVTLRTAEHLAKVEYSITIHDLRDFSQNKMVAPFQFTYQFTDDTPPYVEKMELISLTSIKLYFSEKVDSITACDLYNYSISPEIDIHQVRMDSTGRIVMLNTGKHEYGTKYQLEIRNVSDLVSNVIPGNYVIEYEFRRPAEVDSISREGYEAAIIAEGDPYYVDRDYKIAQLPDELRELTWIKTKNNDKFSTGLQHLSFKVSENVMVYVGYDERNASLPPWLTDWEGTDLVIRDNQNAVFRCYKKAFSPGAVVLGGNYGSDQTNMYVVLVKALTNWVKYPDPPVKSRDENLPRKFELLQNYPNPFNPITEIPFVARESGHVTIAIYDLLGRVVRKYDLDVVAGGQYRVVWDSRSQDGIPVSSGLYICRLTAENFQVSRKMMLVR